jgi:glycine/D-amino acid oxidase-like deaminating enzyme
MRNASIFHPDFKARPFWWEAYEPKAETLTDVPSQARVAIIGAGYAGLAAALQLAKEGIDAVVLEAAQPGFGASTRNGGMVSGGVTVGKRYSGKDEPERLAELYAAAADSFGLVEGLIEDEGIDCEWTRSGRFGGAWCRAHYRALEAKVEPLNRHAQAGASMLEPERQREEIGSDYYHGGLVVRRAAHLHPAKFFAGLYRVARERGAVVCAEAPVTRLDRQGAGWLVETGRGTVRAGDVIVATNGYTGTVTPALRRRVIPVNSYIIATEELPGDLAASLMPRNKSIYDTRRLLTYYRMSGDRRRLIFGGRASFRATDPVETAPRLHRFMTDRFPQLAGTRITHAWTGNVAFTFDEAPHMGMLEGLHYALGCNGSGVAMMTYLGTETARKVAGRTNRRNAFDTESFPDHWGYDGNPWFVPVLGEYLRARDWLDRHFN